MAILKLTGKDSGDFQMSGFRHKGKIDTRTASLLLVALLRSLGGGGMVLGTIGKVANCILLSSVNSWMKAGQMESAACCNRICQLKLHSNIETNYNSFMMRMSLKYLGLMTQAFSPCFVPEVKTTRSKKNISLAIIVL